MRKVGALVVIALCWIPLALTAASPAKAARTGSAKTAAVQPIPVKILGKTIEIRSGMTRSDAKAALSSIIREEPSLDTAERLQYDVQLVSDTAPVTILFDFDKKGVVTSFLLDSSEKDQNPPAAALVDWLRSNAGKPKVEKKGNTTWIFGGWKIEHSEGGTGEDAAYRVQLDRIGK
ncbi:MAG: hypothetical protein P4L43_07460 [Syntrophobacteraceae bacterium]|nr:hypothetical protein [Syntrophobacteraceae bacterium]